MAVLFLCAWKPELTDEIAALLYPAEQTEAAAAEDAQEDAIEIQGPAEEAPDTAWQETADERMTPDDGPDEEEKPSVYIPPELSDISVPEEVAGKNGYQEIQETDSEIEDAEAEDLLESLSAGETGDGLVFDPLFYPYYAMLDDTGQHIYRQIYANANALIPAFAPVVPVNAKQIRDIISAVYYDHPELFWVDTEYTCKRRGNGQCVEIDLKFNRTAKNLEGENAAFEAAAQEILSGAQGFADTYDKECYVHDALLHKTDYSMRAEMNQSAYSALVNGRTVCAGYARAFQYLMQQLGVPCYYCVGYAGEAHAWNIIQLEDGYYNVDVTWDDTGDGTYEYFNKTDDDYADTHVRQELSVYLPPCNGEKYRSASLTAEDEGRRSLADAGFPEDAILHSLPAYYNDCYDTIVQNGAGSCKFSNVIEGEDLFQEWEQAYQTEAYKEEYLVEAMRAIGAKSCRLNLTVEELQQDRYLITHELQLR